MRIGIFTDSYYPHISGVTTSIEMLKDALEHMGHKVYIVAPSKKYSYDKKNGIIWIPGFKPGFYEIRVAEIYSARAMKIIEKEWHLDIIHTQTELSIDIFARMVAKKLNIPIVRTYHTLYEDYTYYVTKGHFDKAAKKLVAKLTKQLCEKKCDKLIVPTVKIKKLFEDKYNIKKDIEVIPTGIDVKRFYLTKALKEKSQAIKKQYKIKDDDFIIGSVGRVAKEKSFDKIIKNLEDIIKQNNKIKFMLVGDGPNLDNLKKLVKSLKLENYVIFTGLVEYNDMPAYYNTFDVMVSYSTTETQGLTVIEGLAASLPTVCINDSSFREMVQNNYNGYLFNNGEEFKKYILNLSYNKELYKTMSMNAKNSIYSYSKEVFAANVLKVYHQALEKKKSSSN